MRLQAHLSHALALVLLPRVTPAAACHLSITDVIHAARDACLPLVFYDAVCVGEADRTACIPALSTGSERQLSVTCPYPCFLQYSCGLKVTHTKLWGHMHAMPGGMCALPVAGVVAGGTRMCMQCQ